MRHFREWPLTALVIVEAIELFVVAPLSAESGVASRFFIVIAVANIGVALLVVRQNRAAVLAVVAATATEIAATVLRLAVRTERAEFLDIAAGLLLLVTVTIVIAFAVFGPGRVTVHRILGAIAIYLNIAAAFALAYRLIIILQPASLSGHQGRLLSSTIYFSFETLTTTGFGDIVPVAPFARSLANLESVVGQLFPATLLARLIVLELEHRRDAKD
jgi:hypothetical protein